MKRLITILLCMAMILSLTACGDTGSSGSPETQSNTAAAEGPSTGGNAESTGSAAPAASGSTDTASAASSGASSTESATGSSGSESAPPAPAAASDAVRELEAKYTGLTEDELKWEYNSASRTIVISGKGPMKDYDQDPEWYQYCSEAECIVIGDEVTSVSYGAFLWFDALKEVKLGQAVEFIGDFAFCDCYELRTVNFPESLKYIGASAFSNALLHSDSGFKFPEGMLYLGEESFYSAFKENSVTIPASLTAIGTGSFANVFVTEINVDPDNPAYASVDGVLYDKNITTLIHYPADKHDTQFEIPGTVTTVLADAIEVNSYLQKIVVPASVTSIEENAIYWNYALSSIEVDENNDSYKSVDGVLFSKDGKKLLAYPPASDRAEYTVPEGTERICSHAMSNAVCLTELHTNEGLLQIGDYGLYYCPLLYSVGFPKSLTDIEEEAFTFCDALSEINYAGSIDDWQKVNTGTLGELIASGSIRVFPAE